MRYWQALCNTFQATHCAGSRRCKRSQGTRCDVWTGFKSGWEDDGILFSSTTLHLRSMFSGADPSGKCVRGRKERNRTANRTAQKRYRERQKSKLQEREDMVAQLMDQVNSLKLERVRVSEAHAEHLNDGFALTLHRELIMIRSC